MYLPLHYGTYRVHDGIKHYWFAFLYTFLLWGNYLYECLILGINHSHSGPPSVPTLSRVGLSEDVSGAVNVTVSWTLSSGNSADFYLINIASNAPQTPYGGFLNITNASSTQQELTGFQTGYDYNITVRGVNCRSQDGRESEPLRIDLQSMFIYCNSWCLEAKLYSS